MLFVIASIGFMINLKGYMDNNDARVYPSLFSTESKPNIILHVYFVISFKFNAIISGINQSHSYNVNNQTWKIITMEIESL